MWISYLAHIWCNFSFILNFTHLQFNPTIVDPSADPQFTSVLTSHALDPHFNSLLTNHALASHSLRKLQYKYTKQLWQGTLVPGNCSLKTSGSYCIAYGQSNYDKVLWYLVLIPKNLLGHTLLPMGSIFTVVRQGSTVQENWW